MRCFARWLALGSLLTLLSAVATGYAQPAPAGSAGASPPAPAESASQPTPPQPPPPAPAPPPAAAVEPFALSHGVVVAAADDASVDAAWELASAIYADPILRPGKLDDTTARVLAGEPPRPGATPRQLELSELRRSFAPSAPASPRLLSAVARELDASAIAIVWTDAPDQVHARLFVASSSAFAHRDLRPSTTEHLRLSWSATTSWLHAQAARTRSRPAPAPSAPPAQPQGGGSFVTSGWFWGALVVAAGAGLLTYSLSSRDEAPTTIHLQGRVVR